MQYHDNIFQKYRINNKTEGTNETESP